MKPKLYQALLVSLLLFGSGCKKDPSSVLGLKAGAKDASFTQPSFLLGSNSGRVIAYDDGDGTGLACLLSYDVVTGNVALSHVSGSTITNLWSTSELQLTSGGTININQGTPITDYFNEVGGWHIIAYDPFGSGHQSDLLVYNPGSQQIYLLAPANISTGVWQVLWNSVTGIGDYDLKSVYDKIIPFEINGNGVKNGLICYRPGGGQFWVIQNQFSPPNGPYNPVAVVKSSGGVAGYDLKSTNDQVITVDFNPGNGSSNLVAYRPGMGAIWYINHASNSTAFSAQFTTHTGFPDFPCSHMQDRIIAYDAAAAGQKNYILCYTPGTLGSAVVNGVNTGDPIGPTFTYLFDANPYTNNYVGDHLISFEGNGSSWGFSTLIGYQNGNDFAQIFDMTQDGQGPNGQYFYSQVY